MAKMKRIVVNKHRIKNNISHPECPQPPLSVYQNGENVIHGNSIEILDDNGNVVARVIYNPNSPMRCGASVWIEAGSLRVLEAVTETTEGVLCLV
jgi:hypothetical protein